MNKRAIIVSLVGLNLLLLGGLILMAYELPRAHAQGVGRGGNYVLVSGEIEESIDALYVLNLDEQSLDLILLNKQGNRPELVGRRAGPDLLSDLREPRGQRRPEQPARGVRRTRR